MSKSRTVLFPQVVLVAITLTTGSPLASAAPPSVLLEVQSAVSVERSPALGDGGRFFSYGSPVGGSARAGVIAIDALNLSWLWGPVNANGCSDGTGSPGVSVGSNELVYATGDWNSCGSGPLVAIEGSSGAIAWQLQDCDGGNSSPHPRQSPPVDEELDAVYWGSSKLCSVDDDSGGITWARSGGYYIGGKGTLWDSQHDVYDATHRGASGQSRVRAHQSNGSPRWTRDHPSQSGPSLIALNGRDDLILYSAIDNLLLGWDRDGNDRWAHADLGRAVVGPGDTVYASSLRVPEVAAIAVDGTLLWRRSIPGAPWVAVDFIDDAGVLYVRAGRRLHAVDSTTGDVLWTFVARACLKTGAALNPEGRIFLADRDSRLMLLDTNLAYAASAFPLVRYATAAHSQGGERFDPLAPCPSEAPTLAPRAVVSGPPTVCPEGLAVLDGSLSEDLDDLPGALPPTWQWDFDLSFDSDGDGDPANDVDAEGERVELSWPTCGLRRIGLTFIDDDGESDTAEHLLEVRDDEPPVLTPGVLAACFGSIVEAEAAARAATSGIDNCPAALSWSTSTTGRCAATVMIMATDACGNSASLSYETRIDSEPPVILDFGPRAQGELWSPNHRLACLEDLTEDLQIVDDCDGPIAVRLTACSSSQPDDGLGDGHTDADCQLLGPEGAATGACVRAERLGNELRPREYLLSFEASDGCGQVVEGTSRVLVRHDRRRGR